MSLPPQFLADCTTADIERLRPKINQLALDIQGLLQKQTSALDGRDVPIVQEASVNIIALAVRRGLKKSYGVRFYKSIGRALKLLRIFTVPKATQSK